MKIAFCFLLVNTLDTEKKWKEFFRDADPELYSVYAHIKNPTSKSPKWMKRVKTHYTAWCGESIVHATNRLYKEALKDDDNSYFCLLSGACVPLFSFDEIYDEITLSKKSRMDITTKFRKDGYFGSLWCVLNRRGAKDSLRLSDKKDKKAQTFIKNMKQRYETMGVVFDKKGTITPLDDDNECPNSMTCHCPDETYLINWLVRLYGTPSTSLFKKHILNQQTTFVKWDIRVLVDHPLTFNQSNLKKYINQMYNSGALFARKFTAGASKMIFL